MINPIHHKLSKLFQKQSKKCSKTKRFRTEISVDDRQNISDNIINKSIQSISKHTITIKKKINNKSQIAILNQKLIESSHEIINMKNKLKFQEDLQDVYLKELEYKGQIQKDLQWRLQLLNQQLHNYGKVANKNTYKNTSRYSTEGSFDYIHKWSLTNTRQDSGFIVEQGSILF